MGILMQKSRTVVTIALLSSFLFVCIDLVGASEGRLLIYMDQAQGNHLKAYGVAYWCLTRGAKVQWLLNYRGGSFLCEDTAEIRNVASMRGVSFLPLDGRQVAGIYRVIEESNMEAVLLEKPPRIAIYTPPESEPWDDAVTLALEYAEIPSLLSGTGKCCRGNCTSSTGFTFTTRILPGSTAGFTPRSATTPGTAARCAPSRKPR